MKPTLFLVHVHGSKDYDERQTYQFGTAAQTHAERPAVLPATASVPPLQVSLTTVKKAEKKSYNSDYENTLTLTIFLK